MNSRIFAWLGAALMCFGWNAPTLADEVDVGRGARPVTLGLGVLYKDQPYKGVDDEDKTQLFPLILWEGKRFFFRADTFGFKLIENGPWEIAPIITFGDEGYDAGDSDDLDGMDDRDPWIGAGAHVIWQPAKFGLKLTGTGDIADESNGGRFQGEGFYESGRGNWFYRGAATAEWVSEGYNQYYFGVERKEEIPGVRPVYRPSDGTNFHLGGSVGYTMGKWLFIGVAKYTWFDDEVDDSPITDDDQMVTLGIGFGYTFGGG